MERFDPRLAGQAPALTGPDWMPRQTAKRDGIFGDRAIGELVGAIVARLGEDAHRAGNG
jgi:hypothetical protein